MSRKRSISTRSTDSTKFAGPPSPLKTTEPPTFRQVIKYSYFMEKSQPTLNAFSLSKLMANEIVDIWKAVNPRLPLLTEKWIIYKVQDTCFRKVKQINRKSLSKVAKNILVEKLDKLFDISSCSCDLPLARCSDKNVKCRKENCQAKHIVCTCSITKKVPLEDREYLKDQRNKIGPKGNFQLGPVDKAAVAKSKQLFVSREKQVDSSPPVASTSQDQNILPSENSDETDESFEPEGECKSIYSLIKIPRYAIELIRGDVSSNLGASLANAFLLDLQAVGLLKPNIDLKNIFLDKSKIDREKERTKNSAYQKHNEKISNLICIGVDGKHDKDTLFYQETVDDKGNKIQRKSKRQEHHLTFTKEMGCGSNGKYLTHRVIPTVGATGAVLANEVFQVLKQYESVQTLKAVLLDNTSTNTGCKSGLVSSLEDKIKRKLHTIGCSLHQNELPFRAIFKSIDGSGKSPTSFTGPLGKLCASNQHHLPQVNFLQVSSPLETIYSKLTENKDLSGDQRLLLEYSVGISRGKVNPKYAAWRIGPLNQSRWLTLAIRLMCIWTRKSYATELTTKMHNLIKFIVQVYAVCWFEIKLDNKFHNQQLYIFKMIGQIKKQPSEIQEIALKNLKFNAFALLPENIIFSMIKSNELEVREEAIKRILTIRNGEPSKKRLKKISDINFNASHWSDLIDLSQNGVSEPALTEDLSDNELREFLMSGRKPDLPDLPAHSQSVERAVKLTSEACHSVYGLEARHRHIIAKILCHEMRPFFASKGAYRETFDIMLQK